MIRSIKAAALVVILIAITPVATAASPEAVDLTNTFRAAGATADRLQVYEIAGVVLIRGRVADKVQAEEIGRIAESLGYARVANLVQVTENRDAEITRRAEIELTVNRSLDGCKFHVTSDQGRVRVAGLVKHELQKDVAAQVLRNVKGIQSVEFALNRVQ
ncbi:MAG TPA: BON domain-containing protein [Thermoanaerobaculia bacterium]|nr:BON domain-containing protein [Thermoanaerobaculia bacterium]